MLRNRKLKWSVAVFAVVVAFSVMWVDQPVEARPGGPGLLCGFTTLWNCDMPFGPDIQIAGTRCDILLFEQQTGATCVIAQF